MPGTYIVATTHLLTAGTDASSPWLLWPVWATMVAIASLTLVRVLIPRGRARRATSPIARDQSAKYHHATVMVPTE